MTRFTEEEHNERYGGFINSSHSKLNSIQELARQIRIAAIHAPNSDSLSCEFGNWFTPKVEKLIEEFLIENQIEDFTRLI